MPELPEVEVVRRGLAEVLLGRRIAAVHVFHPRAVRRHDAGPADFAALASGRTVVAVRRRGKYLWWALDDPDTGDAIVCHLGMSGQFRVGGTPLPAGVPDRAPDTAPNTAPHSAPDTASDGAGGEGPDHPHLRVRFDFADGGPSLRFLDQRTFGGMLFAPGGAVLPPVLSHIAPDPLEPAYDPDAVVTGVRAKHTELKRVLLDQTVVSGIGNIYADEALWRARLHPRRPTDRLRRGEVLSVLESASAVMRDALAQGGTSFDALYVDVNGESGWFERSLNAYGRRGKPCARCGTPIEREAFQNRSSFFCPRCQRAPRAGRG